LLGAADDQLGQPEIADLGLPGGRQQHIARLEVAVHDPLLVDFVDRPGQGFHEGGRFLSAQWPAAHPLRQAAAIDKLQSHKRPPVLLADLINLHDVRMLQAGHGFRLDPEPRQQLPCGVVGVQHHLDGDQAIQALLPGAVHHAHPAATHFFQDVVAGDHGQSCCRSSRRGRTVLGRIRLGERGRGQGAAGR
jgi:hypothetical protein